MWVDTPVKTPAWRRRHSRRACFPGQGRGGPPRGRCRHTMAAGALVPLDATLASQQCTQMPQNGSKGPFSPICVHSCVPGRPRDRAGPRVPRHQQPHGSRDARALGPDGPSVSCQVHAPGRPIVSVAISVPVCVWCRRWLESKTHALAGQTPPVLRLKAARYKTGGAVGHTAFERVCCVRRCHARSERYSWTTTTSPISVRS